MRQAKIFFNRDSAGILTEFDANKRYQFDYQDYQGPAISLTLPTSQKTFIFESFPPFFEGLLPEGGQLEGLLKQKKIDRNDLFSQLMAVGEDLVGAVTVVENHA